MQDIRLAGWVSQLLLAGLFCMFLFEISISNGILINSLELFYNILFKDTYEKDEDENGTIYFANRAFMQDV